MIVDKDSLRVEYLLVWLVLTLVLVYVLNFWHWILHIAWNSAAGHEVIALSHSYLEMLLSCTSLRVRFVARSLSLHVQHLLVKLQPSRIHLRFVSAALRIIWRMLQVLYLDCNCVVMLSCLWTVINLLPLFSIKLRTHLGLYNYMLRLVHLFVLLDENGSIIIELNDLLLRDVWQHFVNSGVFLVYIADHQNLWSKNVLGCEAHSRLLVYVVLPIDYFIIIDAGELLVTLTEMSWLSQHHHVYCIWIGISCHGGCLQLIHVSIVLTWMTVSLLHHPLSVLHVVGNSSALIFFLSHWILVLVLWLVISDSDLRLWTRASFMCTLGRIVNHICFNLMGTLSLLFIYFLLIMLKQFSFFGFPLSFCSSFVFCTRSGLCPGILHFWFPFASQT